MTRVRLIPAITLVIAVSCLIPAGAAGATKFTEVLVAPPFGSCGITSSGSVRCWGDPDVPNVPKIRVSGNPVPESTYKVPAFGSNTSVLAFANGLSDGGCSVTGGAVKCWSESTGTRVIRKRGTPLTPISGLESGATDVVAGAYGGCALVMGGVKCWGSNGEGGLGTGTTSSPDRSAAPIDVAGLGPGSGVSQLDGSDRRCALTMGAVRCWGASDATDATPKPVAGLPSDVVEISGDCARTAIGQVYCWGPNDRGQLGNGTRSESGSASAVQVLGLPSPATAIAGGNSQNCAIAGAQVYCWGDDSQKVLFPRSARPLTTKPVLIPGFDGTPTKLSITSDHACALVDGNARCWGDDLSGQLGDNTTYRGPNYIFCTPRRLALRQTLKVSCLVAGSDSVRPQLAIQGNRGSNRWYKLAPIKWKGAARDSKRTFTIKLPSALFAKAKARRASHPTGLQVALAIDSKSKRRWVFRLG